MARRWITAFLFVLVLHVSTAMADEQQPAADRQVLEGQIAAILSEKRVVLPPLDEGGEMRFKTLPLAAPSEGKVFSQKTAFFEGCVLVVSLLQDGPGWRQMDNRVDIGLIVAEPERVKISQPRIHPEFGPIGGSVTYQWRPEVARRMNKLRRQASEILDEAMVKFPSDVPSRLIWIAERHERELVDKIYLDAGERTYYEDGIIVSAPLGFSPIFLLKGRAAARFVELIYQYQRGYCGERAAA